MIKNIKIYNYKSIESTEIDLGRINFFIGENGCGKTNILEAITFAGAAGGKKLDSEFLVSRGIRTTEPKFVYTAFDKNRPNFFEVFLNDSKNNAFSCKITNSDDSVYNKWINVRYEEMREEYHDIVENSVKSTKDVPKNILEDEDNYELFTSFKESLNEISNTNKGEKIKKRVLESTFKKILKEVFDEVVEGNEIAKYSSEFIIYSPEYSSLRNFSTEGQILPLGIKGDGLLQLLETFTRKKNTEKYNELKDYLHLFSWFDDLKISSKKNFKNNYLHVKDKYIHADFDFFDQRSVNEGFFFLLFYMILFLSDKTPSFFAIDNIEVSFNPKFCAELTRIIVKLAEKYNKQVMITTHNPYILDGLDLNDNEQRLFVVRRNSEGHTKIKRISQKHEMDTKEPIKLSELWMRGYLGALPKSF